MRKKSAWDLIGKALVVIDTDVANHATPPKA